MDEAKILRLIDKINKVESREFKWGSKLLEECSQAKDPRVITALLARHHHLVNKETDSAHLLRNTIKEIDGPSFNTLWSHMDGTYELWETSTDANRGFSRKAARNVLGIMGGSSALDKATRRLGKSLVENKPLLYPVLGKLIVALLKRYRQVRYQEEPITTIEDQETRRLTKAPTQIVDQELYERQMLRRSQENEYFVPMEQIVLRHFEENLAKYPQDYFPAPINEIRSFLKDVPAKEKTETATILDKDGNVIGGITRYPDGRHLFRAGETGGLQAAVLQAFIVSASVLTRGQQEMFSKWAEMSELDWTMKHSEAFAMITYNYLLEVKNKGDVLPSQMQGAMEMLLEEGTVPELQIELSPELKQLIVDIYSG